MKPDPKLLRELYHGIYPADGSMPTNAEARHYRLDESARHQLVFSLMISLAESAAQIEKDVFTIAMALKNQPAGEGSDDVQDIDPDAPAETQAVSGRAMPTPRPAAGPMSAAAPPANTEVTVAPFTPAAASTPPVAQAQP